MSQNEPDLHSLEQLPGTLTQEQQWLREQFPETQTSIAKATNQRRTTMKANFLVLETGPRKYSVEAMEMLLLRPFLTMAHAPLIAINGNNHNLGGGRFRSGVFSAPSVQPSLALEGGNVTNKVCQSCIRGWEDGITPGNGFPVVLGAPRPGMEVGTSGNAIRSNAALGMNTTTASALGIHSAGANGGET